MPLVRDAELSNAREDPFATHGRGVLWADFDPHHPTRGGCLAALRDRHPPPLGSAPVVPFPRNLWAGVGRLDVEERLGGDFGGVGFCGGGRPFACPHAAAPPWSSSASFSRCSPDSGGASLTTFWM